MDRKDIDVKLESDFLEVSGERKRPGNTDSTQGYLNERAYGKFARRFRLPKDIDTTKLAAELKDGLLQITLPKKAEAQPRSIEIKGN
jgi:HSP20 family protein